MIYEFCILVDSFTEFHTYKIGTNVLTGPKNPTYLTIKLKKNQQLSKQV